MASISGYDSSSLGVLFSSLNRNNTTSSLLGGGSDLLGINYSDYATIRNGSYFKLLSAYYSKSDSTDSTTTVSPSISTAKDDAKTLTRIESAAESTEKSLSKLTATGKDSLFASEEKYDADAAYKAVGNFVTQYNDTVDALSKVSGTAVKSAGNHMQNMTNIMSKGLSKVGITVGTDGKLTVDEQKFKTADMSKVKALFDGSSSYAGVVSSAAGRVASQAGNQISQLGGGLYGSNGYYNSYYSGSLYNGYF